MGNIDLLYHLLPFYRPNNNNNNKKKNQENTWEWKWSIVAGLVCTPFSKCSLKKEFNKEFAKMVQSWIEAGLHLQCHPVGNNCMIAKKNDVGQTFLLTSEHS